MAMHISGSCDALIWRSATPLLPAEHMAPLDLTSSLHGNCCCTSSKIHMEAKGLRWYFVWNFLPDPPFPSQWQIFYHCGFLSSPSMHSSISDFLPTVIPTVASVLAWQIGNRGAKSLHSGAAAASASTSDLFWPCHGLCSTKSCSYLKELYSKTKINSKAKMND